MNLETKITIYKFTPQLFTLTLLYLFLGEEILFENKSESSLLSLFVCAECGHQCFAEKQHVVYGRTLRH